MISTKNSHWQVLAICMVLTLFCTSRLCAEEPAAEPESKTESAAKAPSQLPWEQSLAAGMQAAQTAGKPVLVRVGAAWCGWCEKLEQDLADPELQKELSRWTLVYIDSDAAAADARKLSVGPIPALRALASTVKVVAAQDGYLEPEQLLAWLQEQFTAATTAPAEALLKTGPPTDRDLKQLVKALNSQSSTERETAIRRLLPYPAESAQPLVEAFADDRLGVRLAAVELFDAWKAPIVEIDPWRPETVTAERLAALSTWADGQSKLEAPEKLATRELTPEERAAADAEIAKLAVLTESDADATIERLARFRAALLPSVYEALKTAPSDQTRERLSQLRYRLATTDSLVLRWPGGINRLASADLATRHKAATELAELAAAEDEPLLLELFSDPDALVRELSLRALRTLAGDEPSEALVRLLDDPEPNVRAAVLKQLAENPSPSLLPDVAKYVLKEQDADLVVHAIRFLKEVKTSAAANTLIKLLDHESWQVRAEATAALAESVSDDPANAADTYVALIERLDDSDPFVVSRAIKGLSNAELEAKLKPLIAAASRHPELSADVVEALTSTQSLHEKAIPHLREFSRDKNPTVRARAISGLLAASDTEFDKPLLAALQDDAIEPRIAAMEAMLQMFATALTEARQPSAEIRPLRPQPGFLETVGQLFQPKTPDKPKTKEPEQSPVTPDGDAWLRNYQAGKDRPEWMAEAIAPLEKMLSATDKRERMLAAITLVPLGKQAGAIPILEATVDDEAALRGDAAAALPWLLWPERLAFFERLLKSQLESEQLHQVTTAMGQSLDLRSADPLWTMVEKDETTNEMAGHVFGGLSSIYQSKQYTAPEGDQHMTPAVVDAWKKIAAEGRPWQRTLTLALMMNHGAQGDAEEFAQAMLKDDRLAEPFRADALQILLVSLSATKADKLAVEQLLAPQLALRKTAIRYLAIGKQSLHILREGIYLSGVNSYISYGDGTPIDITPPAGLAEETVRPFLSDADADVAACAGYLLAVLGNVDGLTLLVEHWRTKGKSEDWSRPLYRAIAALNDDGHTSVLEEINAKLDNWNRREFYWTIRSMDGPEARKLRKKIRDEVGMENLK